MVPELIRKYAFGNAFAWNIWFPGQTGIYYTVLDTKAKELKPTYIKSMQLNGEDKDAMNRRDYWKPGITKGH